MSGDAHLHAGDRVADRFVLQAPMGAGGSGDVWRALDEQLQRTVALKVLRNASVDDERRLRREARALAALKHPHIVGVYDVVDGPPAVLVLEFVAGRTLRSLLAERLLRVDEVKALARALTSALTTAHDAGVVHGDVKPDNVIVDDTLQRICLIDFGLAAPIADANVVEATRTLSIRGTPGYLAPEVIEGGVSDRSAADRYALGVVLLECLVGDNVFRASSTAHTLARHAERVPPDPRHSRPAGEVDDAFANVVIALLSKAPAQRPSWSTVLRQLDGAPPAPALALPSSSSSSSAASASAAASSAARGIGRWWAVAAAFMTVVVVVGVSALPSAPPVAVASPAAVQPPNSLSPGDHTDDTEHTDPPAAKQNAPESTIAPSRTRAVARPNKALQTASAALEAPAPPVLAPQSASAPAPPAGLPGKRAWLTTHCATEPCASLASAAVPDDLVELQRYRADVDACIRRCFTP